MEKLIPHFEKIDLKAIQDYILNLIPGEEYHSMDEGTFPARFFKVPIYDVVVFYTMNLSG